MARKAVDPRAQLEPALPGREPGGRTAAGKGLRIGAGGTTRDGGVRGGAGHRTDARINGRTDARINDSRISTTVSGPRIARPRAPIRHGVPAGPAPGSIVTPVKQGSPPASVVTRPLFAGGPALLVAR